MNNIFLNTDGVTDRQQFRETIVHGTPRFPMQIYNNDFDWYVNHIIDWHWHPEIEFAIIKSGSVLCFLNDTSFVLNEGDGIFINSNTMHMEKPIDDERKPLMTTVCFLPEFIGDCGSDLIYRKFVRPITGNSSFKGMKLSPAVEWHKNILDILCNIFSIADERPWGYEFKYRNMLSELWYYVALNLGKENKNSVSEKKTGTGEKRLKEMLSYIHANYQRELSVDEIAKSANISKSECFRCFKNIIEKKPITYLNEYRLKQAVNLLLSTDMQITEICFTCGFNHISYFGKIFRQHYGMTPKQFRNNNEEKFY